MVLFIGPVFKVKKRWSHPSITGAIARGNAAVPVSRIPAISGHPEVDGNPENQDYRGYVRRIPGLGQEDSDYGVARNSNQR